MAAACAVATMLLLTQLNDLHQCGAMVASNNTLRSAPSKNTNIPRASMNCGAALEKRVERFASRRMLLCPRYIATINIASADTIFKLNTTRYGKPSVVCVRRSNTMNAPLSSSTPMQMFTRRLKSAATCAATPREQPAREGEGSENQTRSYEERRSAATPLCNTCAVSSFLTVFTITP